MSAGPKRDPGPARLRVVVVGAGPQGLAVLAALAHAPGRQQLEITVVDPAPGWCGAWDAKLARLALDRLRSPQVHHPGTRPMALRDLVEALPVPEQLALRRPEAERVPTPLGMRRLIDAVAGEVGDVRRVLSTVRAVELGDAGLAGTQPSSAGTGVHAREGAARDVGVGAPALVHLSDGTVLPADRVVLAHNPSTPRLPDWAAPWLADGRARHGDEIDLRRERVAGRSIAIVGGGLTAGTLALAVIARGGHATLLTRRPLRARPYDTDASWLGPRRLTEFRAADFAERRKLIDVARDGGTMPAAIIEAIRDAAADPASGLTLREGVAVAEELRAALAQSPPPATTQGPDEIWLATGFHSDASADPLTGPLIQTLGTTVHGGLPEVTPDLRLPETPVHVAGPFAALGVGPACRNLSGARPAGALIAGGISQALGNRAGLGH